MHFGPNECTHCGYIRGPYTSAEYDIPADGVFYRLENYECAFCSDKCLEAALRPYMNDRFALDKDFEDDPAIRQIIENLKTVQKLIDSATLKSNEERAELEEYRIYHADALQEAARAWDQGQQDAIDAALTSYIVQWARESNAHLARVLEKDLKEKKREYQQKLRDEERRLEKEKREQETEKREKDKAYERAEKDHQAFLEREKYEAAIQAKQVPFDLRYEHTHIIGPSGSGKTTLIESTILDDILYAPTRPAYVIIDPKGELVYRISKLALFNPDDGKLRDSLIIVDPFQHPALNLFQLTGSNRAQTVSNFSYIFSTSQQRLTGKQATCFTFCVDLLFNVPKANLFTFLDLLDDRTKSSPHPNQVFADAIRLLPHGKGASRFFEVDFYSANYASTREEIKTRIYELLKNDELAAMFNASQRKLDISDCVQTGKIVLVNTRMSQLKVAHQTLGRFIISLFVDAIQSRTQLPKSEWHPAFLVIDEFQEFADEFKTPEMLRLIREYNGGAVLAHHNMFPTEFNDGIRSAISTNTSIKYASKPAGKDTSYIASDMHCDTDFLTIDCVKTPTHARFGCYYTGLQHPFIAEVQFGRIEHQPKMLPEQHARLLENNRSRLTSDPKTHEAPETEASRSKVHTEPKPAESARVLDRQSSMPSDGVRTDATHAPACTGTPTHPPEAQTELPQASPVDHTEPATKWGSKK